jgi:hypothetical protein
VKRSLLLVLTAALLALGLLAGCGGDDDDGGGDDASAQKEEFAKAYKPINDEFVSTGEDVAKTINTAKGKSNAELAVTFRALAARVDALKKRLEGVDTPEDFTADRQRLLASMEVVARDLEEISDAARLGKAAEAKAKVQELMRHSVETRTARRGLARKAGLPETNQTQQQ